MAYTKVWPEGWKDNEEGGTYINAAGLNHMEEGIAAAHEFMARTDNPHSVTKGQIGLDNVPNVTTNDQAPTYTASGTLAALVSGEKLSAVFGKLAKAVTELIAHLADNIQHITAAERTMWNGKAEKDLATTSSNGLMSASDKTKLDTLSALSPYMELYKTASGNPVSFSDGSAFPVRTLRVTMPPAQSGSGTPYGPGRGKNLCDLSAAVAGPYSTATYDAESQTLHLVSDEPYQYLVAHIRVSLKANTTYTFSAYATVVSGQARIGIRPMNTGTLLVASVPVDGNGWRSTTYTPSEDTEVRLALFCTWSTVGDGDVTYSQIQLEESSTRTAYAPYANLRPITGRESVSVTQSGSRNLFYVDGSSVVRGDGVTPVAGYVTIYLREDGLYSIAAPEAISYDCFSRTRTTLLAGTYTLSRTLSGHGNLIVRVRRVSDRKILAQCNSDGQTATFSLDESTEVCCEFSFPANTTQEYTGWVQLERGSLAGDFVPWRGCQIHTVSFDSAGTVYGGTLDVTAGQLIVTWGNIASYAGETLPGTWLSDRDVYSPGATPTEGAQVVYELAEPVTYQLTAVEIATLLGENHIATDAGSVEVTYRADAALAYQKLESNLTNAILSLGAGI